MRVVVRPATSRDEEVLTALERETWLPYSSPAPYRERAFFSAYSPDVTLVACLDGAPVGYAVVQPPHDLPASAHVLMLAGLGVGASARRSGVGKRLLAAMEERARERDVVRLTLRVLSVNAPARRLYEGAGFTTEGVLRGEFRLPLGPAGRLVAVDDLLMAKAVHAGGELSSPAG